MYFGEPIIPNENMLIVNKLQSNDKDCLRALEMISEDLLYDSKKYIFAKCSPHIVRLTQTSQNAYVLESATQCLRTAVEVNPENVEMLMTSSTIDVICQIFNKEITKVTTEHTIHILHAISKYSSIALTNSLNYNQFFRFINNANNSDIEKRLLSSILLNITQVSVSEYLISQVNQLMKLCSHQDNQISFNSLSSLINIAHALDSTMVPFELTSFLCDKLMDPKQHKVHNKIVNLLAILAKNRDHALVIHQQNLDFERLLFSPEFITSRTDFNQILNLILNLLPYVSDLSIFNLSAHVRPSSNDFDIYQFSQDIKDLMKRVIIEKPLDVKTALIVYAVTLGCKKTGKHQHSEIPNYLFSINYDDTGFPISDATFGNDSDYDTSFFEDNGHDDLRLIGVSDEDNNNIFNHIESNEGNSNNIDFDKASNDENEENDETCDNEIDEDLLKALISFSMIASNAPYILAVISYYGNSIRLNECYLLQLIRDFPIQQDYNIWFKRTIKKLEDSLSKISTPRPLVNLSGLSLQQINQLALDNQIPSYQFLFGGGVRICRKLLEEEKMASYDQSLDFDIFGIGKLAFSLVSLLPMPMMMADPSIEDFINILVNPSPVSIISGRDGKFKSSVPLIEPVWTLKGLVDMTVSKKGQGYLHRLLEGNKKIAKFIRKESIKNQAARPANIACLIKIFENYAQSIRLNYNLSMPIINSSMSNSNLNFSSNNFNSTNSIFHSTSTNSLNLNNNNNNNNNNFVIGTRNQQRSGNSISIFNFENQLNRRNGEINESQISSTNNFFDADNNNNNSSISSSSSHFSNPRTGGNQRVIIRRVENGFPMNSTNDENISSFSSSLNNFNRHQTSKKFSFNFNVQAPEKDIFYPDYENNSIFSIFCDKSKSASDLLKIQPEISLNEKPTKMKFEPLPNQYFTELFCLLKELHDNYNIDPPLNSMLSFVSRVHEQLSNPFGSIGRKSYAMTLIFKYPFLFPFNERVLAYKLVYLDPYFATRRLINEFKSYDSIALRQHRPEPLKFQVRRDHLDEDGFELIRHFFSNKIEIDVKFFEDEGVGVGPTREFLFEISTEFVRKKNKMFRNDSSFSSSDNEFCYSENGLFPSPIADPDMYRLLGILVAKAITMECNLNLEFNPAFFEIARGKKISISKVDHFIANSLKCHEGLLGLNFTYLGYPDLELTPGGKDILVSEDNIDSYIELFENATIDGNVKECVEFFVNGFNRILPFTSLDIFSEQEICLLIHGEKELIKADDLVKYCQLVGFSNESPEIVMLFQTVSEMDMEQQKGFLKFVTGSEKLPIGGLKNLEPPMTIVKRFASSIPGIDYQDQELPTSNTCCCTLKLPSYSTKEVFLKQLDTAISYGNVEFGRS